MVIELTDSITVVFSIIILLLTLFLIAVFSRRRRTPFSLRRIAAYDRVAAMVGRSVEADRPLHLSLGSAGIGGEQTLLALAGAEMAYQISLQAAIGDQSPIVTVSEASALPLAQTTLREAYRTRNLINRYHFSSARWYPTGSRSLAFAAAITAMMADDKVAGNVMTGSYGPELALILTASKRRQTPSIAVSNQLSGQAVAVAMADYPLIGEEIFVSTPYLDKEGRRAAEAVVMDALRWLLILAMLGGLAATIANNGG